MLDRASQRCDRRANYQRGEHGEGGHWYLKWHGNLRTDGPQAALAGALKQGGRSFEALWFGPEPLPSVAELAARHGDPDGQGVHFSADSVRSLWLDRAQPARPTTTLGGPQWPTPPPR